jgi:flagellar biogenesis protein FliO
MTEMILQMITALALVLMLIFILAFVYRKRNKGQKFVSILSYQSLGQKMGIAAVKIGGEIIVLGITPTDFKLIKRFDGSAGGLQETDGSKAGSPQPSFSKGEAGIPRKSSGKKNTGEPAELGVITGTLEKLKKMKEDMNG